MKSVLISIKPKYCELIANGTKTVEVRKTKPKLETPFKCYIYETKEKAYEDIGICGRTKDGTRYNFVHRIGKVIGEFVCDKTDFFFAYYYDNGSADLTPSRLISGLGNANSELAYLNKCCLTHDQLFNYIISEKYGYDWHISDLTIYDKPKEFSEFKRWNRTEKNSPCAHTKQLYGDCKNCNSCNLTRPPQSWCYVEE